MRSSTAFPSRTASVSLVVAVLVFAGCGKGATTAPTSTPLLPGVKTQQPPPPVKTVTYTVNLSGASPGTPAGAPNGSGLAVIGLYPSRNELCWTFSQLKNVTAPKVARIYQNFGGATGRHGRPLGGAYKSSGCLVEPSILFEVLEAHPERFYVAIFNAQFPEGAVRGPL
jgi:hypothetical protein